MATPGTPTSSSKKGRDFYGLLVLEKTATQGQIKQAYRKLAMKYHPDKVSKIGRFCHHGGSDAISQLGSYCSIGLLFGDTLPLKSSTSWTHRIPEMKKRRPSSKTFQRPMRSCPIQINDGNMIYTEKKVICGNVRLSYKEVLWRGHLKNFTTLFLRLYLRTQFDQCWRDGNGWETLRRLDKQGRHSCPDGDYAKSRFLFARVVIGYVRSDMLPCIIVPC